MLAGRNKQLVNVFSVFLEKGFLIKISSLKEIHQSEARLFCKNCLIF